MERPITEFSWVSFERRNASLAHCTRPWGSNLKIG